MTSFFSSAVWRTLSVVACAYCAVAWASVAGAQEEPVERAATVNGEAITQDELVDALVLAYGDGVLNHLINTELLEQEARRRGIGLVPASDPDLSLRANEEADKVLLQWVRSRGYRTLEEFTQVATEADLAAYKRMRKRYVGRAEYFIRPRLLAERMLQDGVKITDDMLRRRYRASYGPKVIARQIVLETRRDAEGVLNRLRSGADFSTLAMERSIDPVSRRRGGTMEPLPRSGALGTAAFKLAEGEISEIIRTDNGYHILKVERKIPARPEEFEEVKSRLREELMREALDERIPDLVLKLRRESEISVHRDLEQ